MVFHVAKGNKEFEKAHNILQDQLKALGGTDDLLCGKQFKLYIHSLYIRIHSYTRLGNVHGYLCDNDLLLNGYEN